MPTPARRSPTSARKPATRRATGRRRRPAAGAAPDTREAIFQAAAEAFSARGFAAVGVDDIARAARVNKAMLYYHFRSKLDLYRAVVGDVLRHAGVELAKIADASDPPDRKMQAFVGAFLANVEARPWLPTLMLREIAEGAPHLDADTLALMRNVFGAFVRILHEGQTAGVFSEVHPVLAYMSTIAPLLLNAARERAAAARPERASFPMFVSISRDELRRHLQRAVVRVLAKD